MLKLMYITNKKSVAVIAQNAGVERIFVDMEYIGKAQRQGGMDTVQNHHTVKDVENIRSVIDKSQLLVRINPVYDGTAAEIEGVISAGADIIMLPMYKSASDVEKFLKYVDGRAKTMLLLENREAMDCLDDVLSLGGADEIHIGLNDLHLSLHKKFLFELLCDGTVDSIVEKISKTDIPYGFGGFGRIGFGDLPAELIVAEHYRLASSMAILSRSFCNTDKITDENEISHIFNDGIKELKQYEMFLAQCDGRYFEKSHKKLEDCVKRITEGMN